MSKYILIFLVICFSFSSIAMKQYADDLTVVANVYKQTTLKNLGKSRYFLDIGYGFSSQEMDLYLFDIPIQYKDQWPLAIRKIYEAFEKTGFLSKTNFIDFQAISPRDLKILPQNLKNMITLAKSSIIDQSQSIGVSILLLDSIGKKFNSIFKSEGERKGFFIRTYGNGNIEKEQNLEPHIYKYFVENDKVNNKLKEAIEINAKKRSILTDVYRVLQSEPNDELAFKSILTRNLLPKIINKSIKKRLKEGQAKLLRKNFQAQLSNAFNILNLQDDSLKKVVPGRIDLLFVYLFYLFDEASKILISKVEDHYDFNNSLSDWDELSIASALSDLAHEIMDDLKINPDIDDKEIKNQKISATKNKHHNHSKTSNKRKIKNKGKLASIEKSQPKPIQSITINNVDESLVGTSYMENLNEPSIIQEDQKIKEGCEIQAKQQDEDLIIEPMHGKMLNSMANDSPSNISMRLKKGHRILDTFARLLARELSQDVRVGSISLALAFNKNDEPKLIISTKSNRSNQEIIVHAINNIIKTSREVSKNINDIRSYINDRKSHINDLELSLQNYHDEHEQYILICKKHAARRKIDQVKFFDFINREDFETNSIANTLRKLLVPQVKSSSLIVLENPFNYHSEINLIGYVLRYDLALDKVQDKYGLQMSYQYIGGSILNCAKCHAIIKGGVIKGINSAIPTTNMVIFTRGNYTRGDSYYSIPNWYKKITKENSKEILQSFKTIESIDNLSRQEMIQMQAAELSDTEDEE